MKIINDSELKLIMLSILNEIDDFCRNNNLTYFLVGGSLLGAIRHKGFIPWDDDIDIGLPRKDYEVFLQKFRSTSGNVEIRSPYNQKHFIWPSSKAIDNRTVSIELGNIKSAIGVYVDVFPFDYIPGTYEQAKNTVIHIKKWKDALTLKHLLLDKNRSVLKNLVVIFGKGLYLVPDCVFIEEINKLRLNKNNEDTCDYICNLCGAWGIRELTKAAFFSETLDISFEGHIFRAPIGYHEYLTTVYGDYMTPPPPEKQVSTHSSISYWKE